MHRLIHWKDPVALDGRSPRSGSARGACRSDGIRTLGLGSISPRSVRSGQGMSDRRRRCAVETDSFGWPGRSRDGRGMSQRRPSRRGIATVPQPTHSRAAWLGDAGTAAYTALISLIAQFTNLAYILFPNWARFPTTFSEGLMVPGRERRSCS